MSVELVNSHVLFPDHANRVENVSWRRSWQSEIVDSEFGSESRASLRSKARMSLGWTVSASAIQANSRLADRIMAAKKSGKACAPFFGRGCLMASPVSGTSVVLSGATAWSWAINDWCIFIDEIGHEVRQITNVSGLNLTLNTSARAHRDFIWPLVFGKFSANDLQLTRQDVGDVTLQIDELVSQDVSTVGSAAPPGTGIGSWAIGSTFIVQ